jgi:hypothetical protein
MIRSKSKSFGSSRTRALINVAAASPTAVLASGLAIQSGSISCGKRDRNLLDGAHRRTICAGISTTW